MLSIITSFVDSLMEMLGLTSQIMSLAVRVWSLGITLLVQLLMLLAVLLTICWGLLKLCVATIRQGEPGYLHVAFFHPYCNAGGGGERVLWCSIRAIQRRYENVKCYVYTGDRDATPQEILERAHRRFGVVIPRPIEFIYLHTRNCVEAHNYPILTLLMQSFGSVLLSGEALLKFRPDIYIDTMGYAFTYPLFRYIGGCSVICYTHYPTISTDMLGRVAERVEAHNNRGVIARNAFFSTLKLGYYHLFAMLYAVVGHCAHVVMVNSTWTHDHIKSLWGHTANLHIVYPPCDTEQFKGLPLITDSAKELKTIVSIGQFRPEKDHPLQLRSFKKLCDILNPSEKEKVRLVLIGGCRNTEDQTRVDNLKALAAELDITEKLIWKLNAPFSDLIESVQTGTIGLHTMWNEHFGICVVECMAGGLIMVAHDSGGPKMDIVVDYEDQRTGYTASDVDSYAQVMKTILEASSEDRNSIRIAARNSVDRFSESEFENSFLNATQPVLSHL